LLIYAVLIPDITQSSQSHADNGCEPALAKHKSTIQALLPPGFSAKKAGKPPRSGVDTATYLIYSRLPAVLSRKKSEIIGLYPPPKGASITIPLTNLTY
jgi:hypothetical protein